MWSDCTEEELTSKARYARFADFLVDGYRSKENEQLSINPAANYLTTLINLAKARVATSERKETRMFFTCLEKNSATEESAWLEGLKHNMKRVIFERQKEHGELIDKSATPIYSDTIRACVRAYQLTTGSAEAIMRALVIICLWLAAGRASEVAWLTFDSLKWDSLHQCVLQEVLQSKTSKSKMVAYVAGSCRHLCWFLAFGDFLTMCLASIIYNEERCQNWMFPDLQGYDAPRKRVGTYFKALRPSSRSAGARKFPEVDGLPDDISGGGVRPGAANTLVTHMPVELACAVTGHDMRQQSALYEYIDAHVSPLIPGSTVLAGWPAFPWGQLGKAPTPPDLAPIEERGVPLIALDDIIDKLYNIDSATPPMLGKTGSLRPAIRCAFASQLMYFSERRAVGEAHDIRLSMVNAVGAIMKCDAATAMESILSWGAVVRERFDSKNSRLHANSTNSIRTPLATVSDNVGVLSSTIGKYIHEQRMTMQTLETMIATLNARIADLELVRPSSAATAAAPASAAPSAAATAGGISTAPPPQMPQTNATATAAPSPLNALMPYNAVPGVKSGTAKLAWEFYWETMQDGGEVRGKWKSDGEKGRAKKTVEWFNAMATETEKAVLKNKTTEVGLRKKLAKKIHDLILVRIREAFREHGAVKGSVKPGSVMTSGFIESRVKELKKDHNSTIDISTFAVWRVNYESPDVDATPGTAEPQTKKRKANAKPVMFCTPPPTIGSQSLAASSGGSGSGGSKGGASGGSGSGGSGGGGKTGSGSGNLTGTVLSRLFAAATAVRSPSGPRAEAGSCGNPGCVIPTGHTCRKCGTPVCTLCAGKLGLEGVWECNVCNALPI
ncbi:hypothetical protein RI054_22g96850 [Pseudoscourfieldia marina]